MGEFETVLYKPYGAEVWLSDPKGISPNRAMYFGDGLFETMIYNGEEIRFWDYHCQRLKTGIDLLGFEKFVITDQEIKNLVDFYAQGNSIRIKWTVYRSGLGKYSPDSNLPSQILHFMKYHPANKIKEKASFSRNIFLSANYHSSLKTLSALNYVVANQEKNNRNLDELILLDSRGNIAEGSASNIFWYSDGKVFTPSLSTGCISGIGRKVIIESLIQKGIMVEEGEYEKSFLLNASHVWVSNVTGISLLHQIDDQIFKIDLPDFLENIL